jgi:two-component system phosphate regulon sensor histidine kinase PhoR
MLIKVNALAWVQRMGYFCGNMSRRQLNTAILLMLLAIVAVATFQAYWLIRNFREEKQDVTFRTNALFREAVQRIRAEKLKLDSNINVQFRVHPYGAIGMLDAMQTKAVPAAPRRERVNVLVTSKNAAYFKNDIPAADSIREVHIFKNGPGPGRGIMQILSTVDSLQDSIAVPELSKKYAQLLQHEKLAVPFSISSRKDIIRQPWQPPELENDNEVTIGFNNPVIYTLHITNTTGFILRSIWPQILVSLLLVGLTVFSFALLLRSLVQQRKLTQIKNDFISNITHELKTPIATVSVAIEALRNFDALHDTQRTKEYLSISWNELQRLSFLVDKVLKLSMFEKHQIELKKETIHLAQLVQEVVNSMKLQLDKYKAQVNIQTLGNQFTIFGDRLHITSVLFNLLDNALKYSKENPSIHIELKEEPQQIQLMVTDNGIGIAAEYHQKIFDKFFRVPAGNTHNVKGYGLGLSYVAYVVTQHDGAIAVESQPGIGSRFIIKLPVTA